MEPNQGKYPSAIAYQWEGTITKVRLERGVSSQLYLSITFGMATLTSKQFLSK